MFDFALNFNVFTAFWSWIPQASKAVKSAFKLIETMQEGLPFGVSYYFCSVGRFQEWRCTCIQRASPCGSSRRFRWAREVRCCQKSAPLFRTIMPETLESATMLSFVWVVLIADCLHLILLGFSWRCSQQYLQVQSGCSLCSCQSRHGSRSLPSASPERFTSSSDIHLLL